MCNYNGHRTWRDECCEAWKPKEKETNKDESIMEELTEKEKDYLLTILYKQDWTETAICDSIIRKLGLSKTTDGR